MSSQPVVRIVPLQPHCFAFGGFELQMIGAMESARGRGADVAPLDFWGREADFEVLHLWGLDLQHSNTVKWAFAGGKKIVLSALVNYPGWKSWLRHQASLVTGPARLRRPMLSMIDCITVVNQAQARYLVGTVGFPAERVAVVPNLVEDIFFPDAGGAEAGRFGLESYVLCTGNICRRKNQLALVHACRKLGVSLLLVGNVLIGEEEYGRAVEEAIAVGEGFRWIRGLNPGSFELAGAYHGAAVFALPSHEERQPISALEAAASGKPLVLGDLPYARQEFYAGAALADPRSVDAIVRALRKAVDQPAKHCPPPAVIQQCRREEVGAAYMAIYQRLNKGTT
jgi:glycosyltransferase involved in cell wall biosynthesis